MLARLHGFTLLGIEAIPLTIECDISGGLPGIHTVGLPDAAVRESAERIRSALRHSGCDLPARRITISLAPADLRKQGSALDLPIALGIVVAAGQAPPGRLHEILVAGELGLDGEVRPVRGVLTAALLAHRMALREIVVPRANAAEAAAVAGPGVLAVQTLGEAIALLRGECPPGSTLPTAAAAPVGIAPDLADVRGQAHARRALEVAAAGGHHLVMIGPPGCGKSMLARRLPGILPPLLPEEAIEVSSIHSAAGLLPFGRLVERRPFRAPHHTISGIGLVGGGRGPRPGEITLAHQGVLFLDELPEFGRATLDVLRQPMEQGEVLITRENRTLRMPARSMFVAAMNPCVCGKWGSEDRPCGCTPAMVSRYRERVSGPLFDRFDLQIGLPSVSAREMRKGTAGDRSEEVARRVAAARGRQRERFGSPLAVNATMGPEALRRHVDPGPAGLRLLETAMVRLGLSARSHDAVLRVARTIADLGEKEGVSAEHVAEAIQYRNLDRFMVTGTSQGGPLGTPLTGGA
ncbi:MAG TPA: YifB family Mg chelatase-like AAA ATPase [Candidatus Polarisedimenticolia bacterium]|nr:YifB family Mg chelatase-like AAA ATPase [Candidatus Polarisedimenticolia bacterium]